MKAELQWEPLASSHIEAMAFQPEESALFIQFKGGSVYRYPANAEEADGMRSAASPGRYLRLMLNGSGERVS